VTSGPRTMGQCACGWSWCAWRVAHLSRPYSASASASSGHLLRGWGRRRSALAGAGAGRGGRGGGRGLGVSRGAPSGVEFCFLKFTNSNCQLAPSKLKTKGLAGGDPSTALGVTPSPQYSPATSPKKGPFPNSVQGASGGGGAVPCFTFASAACVAVACCLSRLLHRCLSHLLRF
jgi:hypothetical protein